MPIRNANFYAAQSTRSFPLADTATGLADDGSALPSDILVDCRLAWPRTAGDYAFVSAVTVSARLVTVLFAVSASFDGSGAVPLLSVTLLKPIDPFRTYLLDALLPGARGAVVFCDVVEEFYGRFSTPTQGLIARCCVLPFRPLPIPTLRKQNRATGLERLVRLSASGDLDMSRESLEIDGCTRDAIVLRLKQNVADRNLLQEYIGECNNRPESRNCLNGAGIETLGGVAPNCAGRIDIDVVGATPFFFANCGSPDSGLAIATDLTLDRLCEGRAADPYAGIDLCVSSESVSAGDSDSVPGSSDGPDDSDSASGSGPCVSLPYTDDFDDAEAEHFVVKIGEFAFLGADSPDEIADLDGTESDVSGGMGVVSFYAADPSRRNVAVFSPPCGIASSWSKRATTSVQLVNEGVHQNGGVVVNYHLVDPLTNPHYEYFLACIDRVANAVRLYRFNGASLVLLNSATPSTYFNFTDWYRIAVEVVQFDSTTTVISVTVTNDSDGGWGSTTLSTSTNRFGEDDGEYGLGTDRSRAEFSYFRLEDI